MLKRSIIILLILIAIPAHADEGLHTLRNTRRSMQDLVTLAEKNKQDDLAWYYKRRVEELDSAIARYQAELDLEESLKKANSDFIDQVTQVILQDIEDRKPENRAFKKQVEEMEKENEECSAYQEEYEENDMALVEAVKAKRNEILRRTFKNLSNEDLENLRLTPSRKEKVNKELEQWVKDCYGFKAVKIIGKKDNDR